MKPRTIKDLIEDLKANRVIQTYLYLLSIMEMELFIMEMLNSLQMSFLEKENGLFLIINLNYLPGISQNLFILKTELKGAKNIINKIMADLDHCIFFIRPIDGIGVGQNQRAMAR